MKNTINTIPHDELAFPNLESVTFEHNGTKYVYADESVTWEQFQEKFGHDVKRVSAMLESSGSSCLTSAFLFYLENCFDPCVYIQFGSSFEDAYESYCDNEPELLISAEDFARDYEIDNHGSYTSDGQPIDTDHLKGFGPLAVSTMTFKA